MDAMFADTAERLFARHVTPHTLATAEGGAWPGDLWQAIDGSGLTLVAAPAAHGGIGASWIEAQGVVRASGRHAVPVPLAEAILANRLLGNAGLQALTGVVTVASGGRMAGGSFSGTLDNVAWGARAQHVVVATGDGALVVLAATDAMVTTGSNIAGEPRDTLAFAAATPLAQAPCPPDPGSLDPVLLGGAAIRTAQIAGALERLLDLAVDHANTRVQFGRAIGKFQAIQHQLAVLSEQTALASAAAAMAFAGDDPLAIASAKAVASEAAGEAAAIAHAVLGAIGFTHEHSLHQSTRRLWSWRGEFGGQAYWADVVGRALCDAGADGFWPLLTGTDR